MVGETDGDPALVHGSLERSGERLDFCVVGTDVGEGRDFGEASRECFDVCVLDVELDQGLDFGKRLDV